MKDKARTLRAAITDWVAHHTCRCHWHPDQVMAVWRCVHCDRLRPTEPDTGCACPATELAS